MQSSTSCNGVTPSCSFIPPHRPDPIAHTLGLPDALLDYPVDTSRAVAKLHYSNTFAPDAGRQVRVFRTAAARSRSSRRGFAIVDEMDVIPEAVEPRAVAETVKRLHWDRLGVQRPCPSHAPIRHGTRRPWFGTDYPYPHDEISIGGLRAVQRTAELDDDERRAVLGGAASRLIPRLVPEPA